MNNPHIPRIILTCGEPAGIGPDLAVGLAQSVIAHAQVVVAGSAKVLSERAGQLGLPLRLRPFNTADRGPASAGELILTDIETARPV
ncbi:MAG: 4-hydroxythreonine-4-phosphate dehydrogenase, partial [Gammaproteobacteria bacterium]|nr:4-hydroxythreonine-4-phosphate dehydrogenase [Gammaproteobacteria bacterium]